MSRLDDLINKLCPDGVECFTVSTVFDEIKGMSGVSNKWADEGNCRFIDYLNAYNNLSIDVTKLPFATVKNLNQDKLKKGDILFTSASEVPDECAIASAIEKDIEDGIFLDDHLFGMRPKAEFAAKIATGYLKHYFHTIEYRKSVLKAVRGVTRFYISKQDFMKIVFPLPPIEVQNEIVRILDNFTELEEELKEELVARRRQYEWAKQKFLNIKKENLVELQSVCRLEKGKTPIQKAIPGEYPLVVTTDKRSSCKDYQFDCKAVCISLVSARGHGIAQISKIFYQEGKFALGNILCAMIPYDEKQLNAKYLQYYLFYMKDILLTPLMKGGANVALHVSDLQTVKIPLPPIEYQEKVVSILNKFDCYCNDLSSGLPAEIEARQKQYEYYRDKLLMFKEK